VCDTLDENPAHLRIEPVMTTPTGVVPLSGGIAEECRHLPIPLGLVSPGENRDRGVWSTMAASLTSCLPWKHRFGGTTMESWGSVVVLWRCCCSGLSLWGAMYAVIGDSKVTPFSVLSKSCHPLANLGQSRVEGTLTRRARMEMSSFGGDCCWSRRGFVVRFE
jgi:hypothetical protein